MVFIYTGIKISPNFGLILAAVFKARMLPFVAMFMIIVAVLFRNRTQFDFSCHESIITYYLLVENF